MSAAFLARRFVSSVAGHLPFGVGMAGRQSRRPLRNGALIRRAVGDAGPYKMCSYLGFVLQQVALSKVAPIAERSEVFLITCPAL